MVLNVSGDVFWESCVDYANHAQTKRDVELYSTINHEMYHYFQTIATGYQHKYVSDMWDVFIGEANAVVVAEQERKSRENSSLRWWDGFNALVEAATQARNWEEQANKGSDLSVMRVQRPSLADGFDTLWSRVRERNAAGLSALDLIEGSAVIYQHALTYGRDHLEDRLAKCVGCPRQHLQQGI